MGEGGSARGHRLLTGMNGLTGITRMTGITGMTETTGMTRDQWDNGVTGMDDWAD